jgi:hypothetical protein
MTIDTWLQNAIADAERRGLPELKPILETLAKATRALRAADFNVSASPEPRAPSHEPRATGAER